MVGAQIFVATVASSRRPTSAAAGDRSAGPYIGPESMSRVPAPQAAETTSRPSSSSPPNVFHVPSPTTGPRRRSSITRRDGAGHFDQRPRAVAHAPEARDGDVLVGRMDRRHPVGEVDAGPAAFVEGVRI